MDRKDGGPAFPGKVCIGHAQPEDRPIYEHPPGMSLRDWFAGRALEGFMQANGWIGYMENPEHRKRLLSTWARDAYAIADAMLKEGSSGD